MDLLSMLMNAKIRDVDGYSVGEVIAVHITMGKLVLTIDIESDDEDEDPDGGEDEDIPEDDACKTGFPRIVALGKKI